MGSSKEYLAFVLEQLSDVEGLTWRGMMGEYLLYRQGKLFGGIYDDRFLVKPTKVAVELLPEAAWESPYEGAKKKMLLVDRMEDRDFLRKLVEGMGEK